VDLVTKRKSFRLEICPLPSPTSLRNNYPELTEDTEVVDQGDDGIDGNDAAVDDDLDVDDDGYDDHGHGGYYRDNY
jgi:hypothetical protein